MKKSTKLICVLAFGLCINQAYSQYAVKKHSINSARTKMTVESYELNGTIGQADASPNMSNENYSLTGGFLQKNTDLIFKNKF